MTTRPTRFPRALLVTAAAFLLAALLGRPGTAHAQQSLVGFWWKPTESGWGLTLQQQGARTFAVWFTYDAQARATWHTLDCAFTNNVCSGDLYTATGTPLEQITGSANITAVKTGTGSLTLSGGNRLALAYTVGSVTQVKANLEPQNFGTVPTCTLEPLTSRAGLTNYTDHWFGGLNASGWGLQISHQGNVVFAGWYSYNAQGNATWHTLQGTQDPGNARRFTGAIFKVDPGIAFQSIAGPVPSSSVQSVGTFEFNFTDGERGNFTYSLPALGVANRTLAIQRLAVGTGNVNACGSSASMEAKAAASRFLSQATFGARMADIDSVAATGIEAWLEAQFAKPQTLHLPNATAYVASVAPGVTPGQAGFQWSMWKNFATADDALRQRVAFALSEIFVISFNGVIGNNYPRGPASYLDMLGTHAFGNFRNLINDVTYHPMMGLYLSHLRNQKENAATGSVPDENYARESMQLFTIGLYELNPDGTQKLALDGKPIETYGNSDVSALGKVFTGLSWAGPDTSNNRFNGGGNPADPDREIKPMQAYNQFHSTSAKTFLGVTIPASTVADTNGDIRVALDRFFNHPNTGPFIGKQLIQKLVSSNPSPAYVGRVAAAFANNGAGVRGDMKAVLRAVLLDPEAREASGAGSTRGKVREPVIRLVHWMRAFNARSADGKFLLGGTTDPATQLAQSPMNSPSVFNFFRPGYVPPNSHVGAAGLLAPEMQITNETSVAGYLNYLRGAITNGLGTRGAGNVQDIQMDVAAELALANNPAQLVERVNLLLTANSLSAVTVSAITNAVNAVAIGTNNPNNDLRNRVNLAIYLVMASPEYLFQK